MTQHRLKTAVAAAALLVALAGCATQPTTTASGPGTPATSQAVPQSPSAQLTPAQQRAVETAEQFTEAVNRGDEAGTRDAYSTDARFDSVGRIYPDRDAIMNRFLIPEVLRIGGNYRTLSITPGAGDRVVIEYEFTTGRGGREHFTYDYLVTDGTIRDVVGVYVG